MASGESAPTGSWAPRSSGSRPFPDITDKAHSYAVDSLVLLLQSVIYQSAYREFGEQGYKTAMNISVYVGMLLGALFWGMSADIIGRRWAFNLSLFICAGATLIAGASKKSHGTLFTAFGGVSGAVVKETL